VTPDGKLAILAYGGGPFPKGKFNQWAKLWDVENGKPLGTLHGFSACPVFLTILADGKTVIGGDVTGVMNFFEIPSCKRLHTLRVHASSLVGVVVSGDGSLALTVGTDEPIGQGANASANPLVKIWDLPREKLIRHLDNCTKPMGVYGISPNHRLAVVGCKHDGISEQMTVFDLKTGKVLHHLPFQGLGGPVQFTADSKRILFGRMLYAVDTAKLIWTTELTTFYHGQLLPGEMRVLGASRAKAGEPLTWHTLDVATGKPLRSIPMDLGTVPDIHAPGGQFRPSSIAGALTPDGTTLVGVVGQNEQPDNTLRVSTMTVQVWCLGRNAKLVKSWRDLTQPDWP
jgi:WD40 repeat protein